MDGDFVPGEQTIDQRVKSLENSYEAMLKLIDELANSYERTLDGVEALRDATQKLCTDVTTLINRFPKVNQ